MINNRFEKVNFHYTFKLRSTNHLTLPQCLKAAMALGSQRARAIGNLFFNVLGLQCATPTYPKICVEGVGRQEFNRTRGLTENGRHRGKFLFGSGNRKEDRCASWADDLTARPTLKFSKPKTLF